MSEEREKLIARLLAVSATLPDHGYGQAVISEALTELRAPPPREDAGWAAPGAVAWRCFHCDEVFTDRAAALLHFGESDVQEPLCTVTAERYREVERRLDEYRTETDLSSTSFHALGAEHYRKERDAEQKGYDRGLADAKAHPESIGLYAAPPGLATEHALRIKAEADAFALAADQCHDGYGDERGNHRCRAVDAAEARAIKVVEALREVVAAFDTNSGAEPSQSVLDRAIDLHARAALAAFDPNPPAPNKEG